MFYILVSERRINLWNKTQLGWKEDYRPWASENFNEMAFSTNDGSTAQKSGQSSNWGTPARRSGATEWNGRHLPRALGFWMHWAVFCQCQRPLHRGFYWIFGLLNFDFGQIEVGPHGHWLVLLHNGYRQCFNKGEDLQLEVLNEWKGAEWHCQLEIPLAYLPGS